jgi:hypothetical protein
MFDGHRDPHCFVPPDRIRIDVKSWINANADPQHWFLSYDASLPFVFVVAK